MLTGRYPVTGKTNCRRSDETRRSSDLGKLNRTCGPRGRPSAGLAVRAARLAKVPIDDVIDGRFPKAGCCPYCDSQLDATPEER